MVRKKDGTDETRNLKKTKEKISEVL